MWRLIAAFLAFPLAYFIFGNLIAPIVLPYYLQGSNELALPDWDQILPVIAIRILLFLLACLPIVIAWNLSNRRLFLTLGLALFILVGGIAMLQAYWLPTVLRVTHGLEIFADEIVYAGALVFLLGRHVTQPESGQVLVPAS
jgi:nitric oxide reductase large subunit